MDPSSSKSGRRDINYSSNRDHSDSGKRCNSWEDQCILEAESDSSAETSYLNEQRNVEQKLWQSFQNTASAIAQLYKDRTQGIDGLWVSFQNTAEIATNMYRDSIEGHRNSCELALQCGYNRRNKEILTWAKKKRRHVRREDLIGYLCGRSPPHRVSRPSSSLSRSPSLSRRAEPSDTLQTFHEAVSMNGLNGAMAGISFSGDASLRRTNSPGRNCQQVFHPDLTTFISEEFTRRSERSSSPSRKRPASIHDFKPSSPKRRR